MGDTITNNFFACTETPMKLVDVLEGNVLRDIQRTSTCETCRVRLTSLIAGTGHVYTTATGLAFDSPQTSLEVNGVRHSIQTCLLTFPAMHWLDISGIRYADVSGAEMQVIFRGDSSTTNNSLYTLVFPIQVGEGVGTEFFGSLNLLQRSRPTLGSLVKSTTGMLLYKGTRVEGRTKNAKTACSNTVEKMNYLVVLQPLFIRPDDFTRLKTLATTSPEYKASGGPIVGTVPAPKKLSLISYIPPSSIFVKGSGGGGGGSGSGSGSGSSSKTKKTPQPTEDGYVSTEQVKCRPLDMARDIKGNMIYVGGPGQYDTLRDELQKGEEATREMGIPEASVDVSRVETILAIVLGVLIGIVLISLFLWGLFKWTTGKFTRNTLTYVGAQLKGSATVAAETTKATIANVAKATKATLATA